MKDKILKLLENSIPLKNSEIAKSLNFDVKKVTQIMKTLKKEGKIISPKRCFYTVEKKKEKTLVTKKEFISLYKKEGKFKTKIEAENQLNIFLDLVEKLLKSGKDVNFTGWGKFKFLEREERVGRNPQNGKEITISAKKIIKFKPGKKLSDDLNE